MGGVSWVGGASWVGGVSWVGGASWVSGVSWEGEACCSCAGGVPGSTSLGSDVIPYPAGRARVWTRPAAVVP